MFIYFYFHIEFSKFPCDFQLMGMRENILLVSCALLLKAYSRIIPRDELFSDAQYSAVKLSPDGQQIAFLSPDKRGTRSVYVRCVMCNHSRQITFDSKDING